MLNVSVTFQETVIQNTTSIEDEMVNITVIEQQGEKGDKGDQGIQGIQGEKGDKGDPGSDATVTQANIESALGSKPLLKVNNPVNIKDYGAKGNGVDDDSVAIQNAINSESEIFFPAGDYVFSQTVEIDKALTIISHEAVFIIDNDLAALRVGQSNSGILNIQGSVLFTQSLSANGVGIKAILGSFNIEDLRGFSTNNWILEAAPLSPKNVNNSYLGYARLTDCGGIYLHNTSRGSLEVILGNIHSSRSTTEVLKLEKVTDTHSHSIIGDTINGSTHNAITVINCGGLQVGKWWVTSVGGCSIEITGTSNSNTGTTSGCYFEFIGDYLSSNKGIVLNCRRCVFGTIMTNKSKTISLHVKDWTQDCTINSVYLVDGSSVTPSNAALFEGFGRLKINSFFSESSSDLSSLDIVNSGNNIEISTFVQAFANGSGTPTPFANGNRPKYMGVSLTPQIVV